MQKTNEQHQQKTTSSPIKGTIGDLWDGLSRFLPPRYLFVWALLAFPAVSWGISLAEIGPAMAGEALNPTGALSAFLLIFALAATPLRMIWPQAVVSIWFLRNRRYLGVASFGYAVLHTLFYLIDAGSLAPVVSELPRLDIWTGWVALLVLLLLAAISNDAAVRKLRRRWKPLQRGTYAAAALTFLHAISLNNWDDPWEPIIVFTPLFLMQLLRVAKCR